MELIIRKSHNNERYDKKYHTTNLDSHKVNTETPSID